MVSSLGPFTLTSLACLLIFRYRGQLEAWQTDNIMSPSEAAEVDLPSYSVASQAAEVETSTSPAADAEMSSSSPAAEVEMPTSSISAALFQAAEFLFIDGSQNAVMQVWYSMLADTMVFLSLSLCALCGCSKVCVRQKLKTALPSSKSEPPEVAPRAVKASKGRTKDEAASIDAQPEGMKLVAASIVAPPPSSKLEPPEVAPASKERTKDEAASIDAPPERMKLGAARIVAPPPSTMLEVRCHRLQACVDVAIAMGLEARLDDRFHMCFCQDCVQARGDRSCYQRGQFPYILPFGWCKLALRISDEQKGRMSTWAPAFHGTKMDRILPILQPPDGGQPRLLFPGDRRADGGGHGVLKGHIKKGFNRTNAHANAKEYFDPPKLIFASPSIRYSEHPAYIPQNGERITVPKHGELHVKFALDVRFSPGQPGQPGFGVGQETVGAKQRLCPMLPNSCLEYYTSRQQTHIITAVMLRIVTDGPLCMQVLTSKMDEEAVLPPIGHVEPPQHEPAPDLGQRDEQHIREEYEQKMKDQNYEHKRRTAISGIIGGSGAAAGAGGAILAASATAVEGAAVVVASVAAGPVLAAAAVGGLVAYGADSLDSRYRFGFCTPFSNFCQDNTCQILRPVLNRGCGKCRKRLCLSCWSEHKCR